MLFAKIEIKIKGIKTTKIAEKPEFVKFPVVCCFKFIKILPTTPKVNIRIKKAKKRIDLEGRLGTVLVKEIAVFTLSFFLFSWFFFLHFYFSPFD